MTWLLKKDRTKEKGSAWRCGVKNIDSDDEKEGKEGKTELTHGNQACLIPLFIKPVHFHPAPFFTVVQGAK